MNKNASVCQQTPSCSDSETLCPAPRATRPDKPGEDAGSPGLANVAREWPAMAHPAASALTWPSASGRQAAPSWPGRRGLPTAQRYARPRAGRRRRRRGCRRRRERRAPESPACRQILAAAELHHEITLRHHMRLDPPGWLAPPMPRLQEPASPRQPGWPARCQCVVNHVGAAQLLQPAKVTGSVAELIKLPYDSLVAFEIHNRLGTTESPWAPPARRRPFRPGQPPLRGSATVRRRSGPGNSTRTHTIHSFDSNLTIPRRRA